MPITISDKDLPLLQYILCEKWYYLKDSLTAEHYYEDSNNEVEYCKIKGITYNDFEGDDELHDDYGKWIKEKIAKEKKQVEKIIARISKKI